MNISFEDRKKLDKVMFEINSNDKNNNEDQLSHDVVIEYEDGIDQNVEINYEEDDLANEYDYEKENEMIKQGLNPYNSENNQCRLNPKKNSVLNKERMRKKWGVKNIRGVLNTIIDKKNGKILNGEQEAIYKEFCKFCMGFVDKKTKMETINAVFDGRVPVELFGEKYEYVDDEKLMRAVLNDLVERFNKPIRRLKSNFEFLQKKRVDWLSRKVSEECILSNIGIKWNELIMSILSRYSKDLLDKIFVFAHKKNILMNKQNV